MHPARPAIRAFLLVATTLVVALVTARSAQAAPGDLTFDQCLSDNGSEGVCTDLAAAPLNDTRGVVMSPDGSSLYAVGYEADGITHFTVGADGRLTFAGCLSNSGANGCVNLPGAPIEGAFAAAVSSDGGSVYVVGAGYDTIAQFSAAGNGALTFVNCFSSGGEGGCTDLPASPFDTPEGLAVSPDGDSVYVAGRNSGSIAHFFRAAGGGLIYGGCVSNDGSGGCTDIAGTGTPISGAGGVAVRPDGSSVYLAGANGVSHFSAAPAGQLTFGGCVGSDGSNGCTDAPGAPLTGARGVAVSADGAVAYVATRDSGSVVSFTVAPGGQITFADCVSDDGGGSCQDAPGQPLSTSTDLSLSPDGRDLYTASFGSYAVSRLAIGPDGKLTWGGCVQSFSSAASPCVDQPGDTLFGVHDVVVAPNGNSVYAADLGDRVSHFAREGLDTSPPVPDTSPPVLGVSARKGKAGKPISVRVTCSEACAVEAGGIAKPKGSRNRALRRAAADLGAGQQAMLKLKPGRKLKRKLRRVGRGKATIEVTATDVAGNAASESIRVKLK